MKLTLNKEQIEQAIRDGEITIEVPKQEKWEPSEEGFHVNTHCVVLQQSDVVPTTAHLKSGSYRKTRKQAEQLAELRRKQARLHAFVCEQEGDDAGWIDSEENCYLIYDQICDNWIINKSIRFKSPSTIYMRESTAKKAVEMLNNGTLEL